jgi:L-malate glycosyltransferase
MRILQVSSARAFGGGERHLADLARALAERGHEVYAALVEDSPLGPPLASILEPTNVFTAPMRNSLDLRGAMRLARLARELRVEVIHAHVARDYTLAAFAARRARASRLVITRHVLFPLGRVHRRALSNVSRVIAVSPAVARSLQSQRIFDAKKIRVVTNGVDLRRFEEARAAFERKEAGRGAARRPLRVGIVGELSEVKGQGDFVRAAASIRRELAGRVEFLIVGDESSRAGEYASRLERLIAELRLTEGVRIVRRCEDVAPLIASLDVLVSASRSEAFGMVMVEAAACGVPVVATATEGAREIVTDGVTGSIVPIGDVGAMASAVAYLLRDEGLRRAFGRRARETARARFGLERTVTETEAVYAEALAEDPRASYLSRRP